MEERGLARATVARRLSTISGLYSFAVVDGLVEHSPAEFVRRPKITTDSATLGRDRMELSAFIACGAAGGPMDHALACLLGLLGLRVSEACSIASRTWASSGVTAPSPCSARGPSWP
jgi:integrase/recombinase XerD